MTEEEVRAETQKHIDTVGSIMGFFARALKFREEFHDHTKLQEPEFLTFRVYTEKLRGLTYGSDEYKKCQGEMKPAMDHHYENNRHHPEHFESGISGMNLIDLVEMFCDWKAATLRHADGDLNTSIEINSVRFNIGPQLVSIFKNTVVITDAWDKLQKIKKGGTDDNSGD